MNARPSAAASIPGRLDIWVFVAIEFVIFSSYFVAYMLYRRWNAALFLESQQQLDPLFGVANTVILLLSSGLVARAVQSARDQRSEAARRQLYATMALGALFVASKLLEWSTKIRAGQVLTSNDFFSFYYFLTGIHVVHVLAGFGFLGVAIHHLRRPQGYSIETIEAGGIYWHMVDFLWVIIFALLYLMR